MRLLATLPVLLSLLTATLAAHAGGGPLGIDRTVTRDEGGPWNTSLQSGVYRGMFVAAVAGALVEGTDTRLGRTLWRSAEGGGAGAIGATVAKRAFSRKRPSQGGDPDAWFEGRPYESFPSGHVTVSTALVTPFLMEYGGDVPAVWGLAAVPAWLAVGRVKAQAHWQTDVLGGALLGTAAGWASARRDTPLVLSVTGDGTFVGLRYRW